MTTEHVAYYVGWDLGSWGAIVDLFQTEELNQFLNLANEGLV